MRLAAREMLAVALQAERRAYLKRYATRPVYSNAIRALTFETEGGNPTIGPSSAGLKWRSP